MTAQRAQSAGASSKMVLEPVNIRFLKTMEAFNASKPGPPSYSIAGKLSSGQFRGKVHTEPGPDISHLLDCSLPATPKWTLKGRWKADKAGEKAWVPAPGTYNNPSTLDKTHPTLPCSGRGWTWGSQERPSLAVTKDGPGPTAYRENAKDAAMTKEPAWSFIGRDEPPASKMKGKMVVSEPNLLRDISGMHQKGGVIKTPEWQFTARPASSLIPAKACGEIPGPDVYYTQSGGIGSPASPLAKIKRSPSYGFGSCPRFKQPKATAHIL